MNTYKWASFFCFGSLLSLGWFILFGAVDIIESRKFIEIFLLGLGAGISFIILIITDPKGDYVIHKKKEEET